MVGIGDPDFLWPVGLVQMFSWIGVDTYKYQQRWRAWLWELFAHVRLRQWQVNPALLKETPGHCEIEMQWFAVRRSKGNLASKHVSQADSNREVGLLLGCRNRGKGILPLLYLSQQKSKVKLSLPSCSDGMSTSKSK